MSNLASAIAQYAENSYTAVGYDKQSALCTFGIYGDFIIAFVRFTNGNIADLPTQDST